MPRLTVNGIERSLEYPCLHWGELLSWLDGAVGGSGQVVTAVRFDGVDQPAFRSPEGLSLSLSGIHVIDAETVSPADLIRETVQEAVRSAEVLAREADRIGADFRGYGVEQANRRLGELAEGLRTMVAMTQTLSAATGIGLDRARGTSTRADAMIDELARHADALVKAREDHDWITVADIIEYDIAPVVRQWPALFEFFLSAPSH